MQLRAEASLLTLGLLSALILFLEMLLIRWVGTEVRIFAYLQNGLLVAAFLGLGLGARNARRPARLLPAVLLLVSIALLVRDPLGLGVSEALTWGLVAFQDTAIWAARVVASDAADPRRWLHVALSLGVTLGLLAAVAGTFHPLGQWLGRWMDSHPRPIAAYTANVLGSLAGIALFHAFTLASWPPPVWLAVVGVGLAILAPISEETRAARVAAGTLALALPLLAWPSGPPSVWSPYQKLTRLPMSSLPPGSPGTEALPDCGELIQVNNTSYQLLVDLDPERMATAPALYPPDRIRTSHYMIPYELVGIPERVLVVGAGAGNDVAAALRAGAGRVRAVEIDPAIVDIGRERHPNAPYASDRVEVAIDDARAFFQRDTGSYDLVLFGLLDSHTTPSAYTNVRLDHFVYTQESFTAAKRLLAPGGFVVLFFAPQAPWIAYRLAGLLRETFGTNPLGLAIAQDTPCLGWGGLLLIGGEDGALAALRRRVRTDPGMRPLRLQTGKWPLDTPPSTDDWPYLYLEQPSIPRYHLLVGGATLLLGVLLRRRLFRPGETVDGTMLLLGTGFMLLEVSAVSRAALLFGTTWTVNAYVIGAILSMALLANLVAGRVRPHPMGWPAFGLLASLVAHVVVPTAWLATLPLALRISLGAGFLSLPVFFSGLIFVALWAESKRKDLALGSNILGSLLGGLASMLSMLVGFRWLLVMTLAIYTAALLRARARPVSASGLMPR